MSGALDATVVEQDTCFRVVDEDGYLWVTELLHTDQGDVPKRWRIRFSTTEAARRLIAAKLRDGHNELYHFARPVVRVG